MSRRMSRLAALAVAVLSLGTGTGPAPAAAPAPQLAQALVDPAVTQALADIERYEGLAAQLAPGDKATGRRYMNELKAVYQRLSSVQDKSQPKWVEAANRFNALQKRIVDTANQPAAAAPAPGTPAPGTPAPGVAQPAPAQSAPQPRLTSSDQARLNRTARAIQSLDQDIERSHFQVFLDADDLAKLQRAIAAHRETLAGFPAEIAEVAAAGEALDKAAARLDARVAEAKQRAGAVGDIDSQLAQIEERLRANPVPQPHDFKPTDGPEAAAKLAKTLSAQFAQSTVDLATIEKIAAAGFKDDRINRLRHWAGAERQRQIATAAKAAMEALDGAVQVGLDKAAFLASTDPSLADHRANRLLGKGRRAETLNDFDDGLAAVATAKAFDQALGRKDAPDRDGQAATLTDGRKSFEEKFAAALGLSRMPPAGITEERYLAIAKEALANPDYKIGPYRRLVINSRQVQRKERKEAELRSTGAATATATIYHWVWDELQVATAEPVGDEHYVFYNTLKFFHSGAPTTPLNRWVLSGRFQGDRILEANIDK